MNSAWQLREETKCKVVRISNKEDVFARGKKIREIQFGENVSAILVIAKFNKLFCPTCCM
jgi:hypothetical protein